MPAHRLPWFKFWPEAMQHEKVALLDDGEFRTWLAILSYGSTQPTRWRFASAKHAAVVCGRPIEQVEGLIAAHLLDTADGELWIHDWKQWQDVYPSDFSANGAQSPGEKRRNAPRTLRERSDEPPLRRRSKKEKIEREDRGESPTETLERVPLTDQVQAFDREMRSARGYQSRRDLLDKVQSKYVSLDLEEEALKITEWLQRKPGRVANTAFVLNWLGKALEDAGAAPLPTPPGNGTLPLPRGPSETEKYARGIRHV
jgi:hypothetical protein